MVDQPLLLTFDCYGTLIDWETGIRRYLSRILERKGSTVDLEEFYRHWYFECELRVIAGPFQLYRAVLQESLQMALRDFGLPVESSDGSDFGTAMESWQPFPESVGVLRQLSACFPLAVISNSQHDIIRHSIELLGNPFRYVVTAQDARAYKPSARPFEFALERAGVRPEQAVHIAQSQFVDLPRSVPMGIRTIWVNRNAEELRPGTPAPDVQVSDLRPIPELLNCR